MIGPATEEHCSALRHRLTTLKQYFADGQSADGASSRAHGDAGARNFEETCWRSASDIASDANVRAVMDTSRGRVCVSTAASGEDLVDFYDSKGIYRRAHGIEASEPPSVDKRDEVEETLLWHTRHTGQSSGMTLNPARSLHWQEGYSTAKMQQRCLTWEPREFPGFTS
eukprot:TRINITY_DN8209_c0_g1_i1.p1 TRINITY_DN8209_c0_g1~~TRINITY_DN8209_c0_g1_i1.p1  ORF type:complete len:169 (-),score=6.44 TRINITY_DN8209_c0_g1_i1:100-606(-)